MVFQIGDALKKKPKFIVSVKNELNFIPHDSCPRLPEPKIPPMEMMPTIAIDAFTITIVTYTISMSMALIFANKEKYEVDANQELLALVSFFLLLSTFRIVKKSSKVVDGSF